MLFQHVAIAGLAHIDAPRRLSSDGAETDVPVAQLHPGDRIALRPGDRVPTAGIEDLAVVQSKLAASAVALDKLKLAADEQIGVNIVKRALEEPLRLIVQNAGHEGAVVVEKVKAATEPNFGFDAEKEQYTDLVKAGVIDPAKVTRLALQNAASIAGLMLTTEALVSEIPEEEKERAPAGHPGMGGMY